MADVIWDRAALADLNQTIAYIEQFDAEAADRIGTRLFDLGESLAQFPHRGRRVGRTHREMTNVPPYILRYTVKGDLVTILGIRHGARQPDTD
ncbi:type II toxin-antitoxin system RelE/ParE family toxin [Sphingomonas sp. RP10(2022)]|uniref:Type II toxin-antitoxin system RelE/ParE family toxin n=1 Tax=Sphingomonas liriopis TaxID=2949094 RepID=A0A9X2KPP7_9SPHN|nr:type II toxin-antitoxin system RelE/ParE family toxin [Sphingomonas liriopis]MCP3734904.1 type II toxin-antitoxin system RelE/ParE family toxin [Sphingomonas liriopis]